MVLHCHYVSWCTVINGFLPDHCGLVSRPHVQSNVSSHFFIILRNVHQFPHIKASKNWQAAFFFYSCLSTYGINLTETHLITTSWVQETPTEPQKISTSRHFTKSIFCHFTLNNASDMVTNRHVLAPDEKHIPVILPSNSHLLILW